MILSVYIYACSLYVFMLFYSYTYMHIYMYIHTYNCVQSKWDLSHLLKTTGKHSSTATLIDTVFTFTATVNVTDSSQDRADCAQDWCPSSWIGQSPSHPKPQLSLCSCAASLACKSAWAATSRAATSPQFNACPRCSNRICYCFILKRSCERGDGISIHLLSCSWCSGMGSGTAPSQLLLPQLQPKPYLPSHTACSLEAGSCSSHQCFAAMDRRKCNIRRTWRESKDP